MAQYDDGTCMMTWLKCTCTKIFHYDRFLISTLWAGTSYPGLLLWPSSPLDSPDLVELWCIGAFGGHIKLNIHQTMGPMME